MNFTTRDYEIRLGLAVKELRKASGLNQLQLAEQVGINSNWLSDFERGERPNAGLANIVLIASSLNISVSDLFKKAETINL